MSADAESLRWLVIWQLTTATLAVPGLQWCNGEHGDRWPTEIRAGGTCQWAKRMWERRRRRWEEVLQNKLSLKCWWRMGLMLKTQTTGLVMTVSGVGWWRKHTYTHETRKTGYALTRGECSRFFMGVRDFTCCFYSLTTTRNTIRVSECHSVSTTVHWDLVSICLCSVAIFIYYSVKVVSKSSFNVLFHLCLMLDDAI